jgi:crossover junction endodeoxyribonuclease RuvC
MAGSNDLYVGIDPSTLTGLVIMDSTGKVIEEKEIHLANGIKSTSKEIQSYGRYIASLVPLDSEKVGIEWFSLASKGQAVSTLYGIGYAIRYALNEIDIPYLDITPSALKKMITGKGNSKKEIMIKEVYKKWGYEHPSNNVIDAYALARYMMQAGS